MARHLLSLTIIYDITARGIRFFCCATFLVAASVLALAARVAELVAVGMVEA